jgi:hypothetical protein
MQNALDKFFGKPDLLDTIVNRDNFVLLASVAAVYGVICITPWLLKILIGEKKYNAASEIIFGESELTALNRYLEATKEQLMTITGNATSVIQNLSNRLTDLENRVNILSRNSSENSVVTHDNFQAIGNELTLIRTELLTISNGVANNVNVGVESTALTVVNNSAIPEINIRPQALEPVAQFSVPPLPHQEEAFSVSPTAASNADSNNNILINLMDGVDRISRASHSVNNAPVPAAEATSNVFSGGLISMIWDLGSMLPSTIATSVTIFSQTLTIYRENQETIKYLWDFYKPQQQSYIEKAFKLYLLFKKF